MEYLQVDFYKSPKIKYSTKRPPTEGGTRTLCYLKDETSVLTPTLQIHGAEATFGGQQFPDFNVAYIEDFHRYYYVRNVTAISKYIWEVSLEVDVLATYKDEIKSGSAFIQYATSGYNSALQDGRLMRESIVEYSNTATIPLPDVFSESGCFALTAVNAESNGKNGLATTYIGGASVMQSISNSLNEGAWEAITRYFQRPMDSFISCIWLPISLTSAGSGFKRVKFGEYDTGVDALEANDVIEKKFSIAFVLPYDDGDYRNIEPYTELKITLPGVGLVQLPLCSIYTGSHTPIIDVDYAIDTVVGKITYRLSKSGGGLFMVCDGQLGVPLPLSASTFNVGGYMSGVGTMIGGVVTAAAIASTGGSAAIATAFPMAMGTTGAITSASQNLTSVSGSVGSRSGIAINARNLYITITKYKTSDTISNVASNIGAPVFRKGTIGNFGKFVQCVGAQVTTSGTAQEVDAINEYLKGGILIE